MIDTHAHLYDEKIIGDLPMIITKSQEIGVQAIYMPNLEEGTLASMLAVAETYPNYCYPMIGLHPCSVQKDYPIILAKLKEKLHQHHFIGIGEVGLDFYWTDRYRKEQIDALKEQLDWAKTYDLPVALHARNSIEEVISIIAESGLKKGVFHCFSGTRKQAEKIIDMGFFLGIGGVITFSNSNLGSLIADISIEHLLLETDAPYLTPTPYRGKANTPQYLPYIAASIAFYQRILLEEVKRKTTQQALALFQPTKWQ